MKNYKQLLKTVVVMAILGGASNAFAQIEEMTAQIRIGSGSGGKIGSGAGGRAMFLSTESINGEVVVPYPGAIPNQNSLIVRGESGNGQSDKVVITVCNNREDQQIQALSCEETLYTKLNTSIEVPNKIIQVVYGNTIGFFQKKEGEALNINLNKISIPNVQEIVKVKVFVDLRSQEEYKKAVFAMWGAPGSRDWLSTLVKRDIKSFGESALQVDEMARFSVTYAVSAGAMLDFKSTKFERQYIAEIKTGDFISVLPGVYGFEWTNTKGEKAASYGVKVD